MTNNIVQFPRARDLLIPMLGQTIDGELVLRPRVLLLAVDGSVTPLKRPARRAVLRRYRELSAGYGLAKTVADAWWHGLNDPDMPTAEEIENLRLTHEELFAWADTGLVVETRLSDGTMMPSPDESRARVVAAEWAKKQFHFSGCSVCGAGGQSFHFAGYAADADVRIVVTCPDHAEALADANVPGGRVDVGDQSVMPSIRMHGCANCGRRPAPMVSMRFVVGLDPTGAKVAVCEDCAGSLAEETGEVRVIAPPEAS